MTKLQVGDQAPEFKINVAENKIISLSNFTGKYLVLYFYPKDSTPGCTIEAQDFNHHLQEFSSMECEVIGISKDDLSSHDKFCQKHDLRFMLGADTEGIMCKDYDVWAQKSMFGKKYMGINRSTFLIDPTGKIIYIWPKVSVSGHAKSVLNKLRDFVKS